MRKSKSKNSWSEIMGNATIIESPYTINVHRDINKRGYNTKEAETYVGGKVFLDYMRSDMGLEPIFEGKPNNSNGTGKLLWDVLKLDHLMSLLSFEKDSLIRNQMVKQTLENK